eukprot:jgi/Bigna1/91892/estExt_fgenesh1_pg.C_1280008
MEAGPAAAAPKEEKGNKDEGDISMFELIKTSTYQYLALESVSRHVKVHEEAVVKFAATIGPKELRSATRTPFPLQFKDRSSEINFLGLLHALNFGSGYRELLHQYCKRGAYETIAHGCIGAHISQTINADFLLNLKLIDIPQLFGIPIDMDVEIKPAMYSTQHSPVRPLASKIVAVCNEMGRTMRARQWEGFSDFVMETLRDIRGMGQQRGKSSIRPAADFVKELGKTFPSVFKDAYEFRQQDSGAKNLEGKKDKKQDSVVARSTTVRTVHVYKKAQLLVNDLHRRFKDEEPSLFDFEDIDNMTVCADNVLPAALRHYGILEYSEELGRNIDSRQPLKNREMECALRAGSIVACEMILKELKKEASTWDMKENIGASEHSNGTEDDGKGKSQKEASLSSSSSPTSFSVGHKVKLQDLKKKEYNDLEGIVMGELINGRHGVELLLGPQALPSSPSSQNSKRRKLINVKPRNMKLEATYSRPRCRPLSESDLKQARETRLDEMEDYSYGCIVVCSTDPASKELGREVQQHPQQVQQTCVLLIKPKKTSRGYTFPKGHPDAGENIESCALRETREETGVSVSGLLQTAYSERSYSFIGKLHSDKWKRHSAYPDGTKRPSLVMHKTERLYFAWCSTLVMREAISHGD